MLKPWLVTTRDYETYSCTGIDPPEWGCDFAYVECEKRDAKALGWLLIRKHLSEYGAHAFDVATDGECPFTGMTVEPAMCSHGTVYWGDDCLQCAQEQDD